MKKAIKIKYNSNNDEFYKNKNDNLKICHNFFI